MEDLQCTSRTSSVAICRQIPDQWIESFISIRKCAFLYLHVANSACRESQPFDEEWVATAVCQGTRIRCLAGWNGNVQGKPKHRSPLASLGGFATSGVSTGPSWKSKEGKPMAKRELAKRIDELEKELKIVTILAELLNETSTDDFHFKGNLDRLHCHSLSLNSAYELVRPELFRLLK